MKNNPIMVQKSNLLEFYYKNNPSTKVMFTSLGTLVHIHNSLFLNPNFTKEDAKAHKGFSTKDLVSVQVSTNDYVIPIKSIVPNIRGLVSHSVELSDFPNIVEDLLPDLYGDSQYISVEELENLMNHTIEVTKSYSFTSQMLQVLFDSTKVVSPTILHDIETFISKIEGSSNEF